VGEKMCEDICNVI